MTGRSRGCKKRNDKLKRKQDIEFVFAKPKKARSAHLLLLARPNALGCPRIGTVVSKRLLKTAVARNRLKRVVYESFRHHKEILKGLDIVIVVRSECNARDKAFRVEADNLFLSLMS